MLNKSLRYSVLSVDLVELDPGESFTFQLNPASASYGVFALGGSRSSDDATEVTDPAMHGPTTASRPRCSSSTSRRATVSIRP